MADDRDVIEIDAIIDINYLLSALILLAGIIGGFMVFFKLIGFATIAAGAEAGLGWLPAAFAMGASGSLMQQGPGPAGFTALLGFTISSIIRLGLALGLLYVSTRGLEERMAVGWYATVAFYGLTFITVDNLLVRLVCLLPLFFAWQSRDHISSSSLDAEIGRLRGRLQDDIHHFREGDIDELFPDEQTN